MLVKVEVMTMPFVRFSALAAVFLVILGGCQSPLTNPPVSSGTALSRAADLPPSLPRLTGVNWFGFETGNGVPHGLWARDYKSMLRQMRDLGFNCIRLPWSDAMWDKTPTSGLQINAYGVDPYTKTQGINADLAGLSSLQILDKIVDEAGRLGLRLILDNHSREADGYYNQTLWYTAKVSEAVWIDHWKALALRYKGKPQVVAADLSNEPHGGYLVPGMTPAATWGFNLPGVPGPTDWKAAAERCAAAVRSVNPDWIIVIQGVQDYEGSNYWWGSNLKGVKTNPVLSVPRNKLFYSVHEYGPEVHSQDWFTDPRFPANLEEVWRDRFWFIQEQGLAGLYIGEIGIKEETAADPSSIPYRWLTTFLKFAGKKVHFTWWSWNPNSGDTGGILKDDWLTVNNAKYQLIKPYLEPVGTVPDPNPNPDPDPNPNPNPNPQPASLQVLFQPGTNAAATNTLGLRFQLKNTGASAVALNGVSIRYWFTADGRTSLAGWVDHAGGTFSGSYRAVTAQTKITLQSWTPSPGADSLAEISFAGAPSLGPGDTLEVQTRVTNGTWQDFRQTGDHSFLASAGTWSAPNKIQLRIGGTPVSGIAP